MAIEAAGEQRASDAGGCEFEGDGRGADEKTGEAAFRKILRWVSVRERSSAYVRERRAKDEFSPEAIDEALERALRVRVVDDRRYGDALIRMKLAAGKGLRAAEAEIIELGIDPSTLDAWQEHAERGRDAEVQRALACCAGGRPGPSRRGRRRSANWWARAFPPISPLRPPACGPKSISRTLEPSNPLGGSFIVRISYTVLRGFMSNVPHGYLI